MYTPGAFNARAAFRSLGPWGAFGTSDPWCAGFTVHAL